MIRDSISLSKTLSRVDVTHHNKSILQLVSFLEKHFNAQMVVDTGSIPYGREDLIELFRIAKKLIEAGVITDYSPAFPTHDEPLRYHWSARCGDQRNSPAGGMSFKSDYDALISTLAEALERYLWYEEIDFLKKPIRASTEGMIQKRKKIIDPLSIVSFSKEKRSQDTCIDITPETRFLWTKGYSWVQKKDKYLPAQLVSVCRHSAFKGEPYIFIPITTGLATWPTREGAVLSGAMEIIERDAFMITWHNQLHLPKIDLENLASKSDSLAKLIATSARYGLEVSATRMPTDAPAYAVCGSVKDIRGHIPEMVIGLKAGADLASCVEGALLEALRMRINIRGQKAVGKSWDKSKDVRTINHMERVLYWAEPDLVPDIYFLAGTQETIQNFTEDWDGESKENHLLRVVAWAKEKNYEMTSVSLGDSKKNVSPWYVEMVVMPDLQPMHQNERYRYTTGKRLSEIPQQFGYKAAKNHPKAPHPFA